MAHRGILQRRAISVAKGAMAEIVERLRLGQGDAFDPNRTFDRFGFRECLGSDKFASMLISVKLDPLARRPHTVE
jgi:hypothetical protein